VAGSRLVGAVLKSRYVVGGDGNTAGEAGIPNRFEVEVDIELAVEEVGAKSIC
jgi:hypothetical protein